MFALLYEDYTTEHLFCKPSDAIKIEHIFCGFYTTLKRKITLKALHKYQEYGIMIRLNFVRDMNNVLYNAKFSEFKC